MMGLIFSRLGGFLAGAFGIIAAISAIFLKGQRSGRETAEAKAMKDRQVARDAAEAIDRMIGIEPADAKRDELKKWSPPQ